MAIAIAMEATNQAAGDGRMGAFATGKESKMCPSREIIEMDCGFFCALWI